MTGNLARRRRPRPKLRTSTNCATGRGRGDGFAKTNTGASTRNIIMSETKSKHRRRAACDCGRSPTVYHNSYWVCARCAELENRLVNKDAKPRDRSRRIELPEYRVALAGY